MWHSLLTAGALVALSSSLLPAAPRRVVPGGADLRAAPADTAFVVTQVLGGETVAVRGDAPGPWVSVTPPDRVSLWMYGDLVRNGVVIAPKVEVRAGPGIDYEAVGAVTKGTQLIVRGNQGAWLEIAPPAGCLLWLKRAQLAGSGPPPAPPPSPAPVQPPAAPRSSPPPVVVERAVPPQQLPPPSVAPTPPVAAPVPPTATVRQVPPPAAPTPAHPPRAVAPGVPTDAASRAPERPRPAPPAAVTLPAGAEPVGPVTVEGVVRPRGIFYRRMTLPYRLVRRDEYGRSVTVCVLQAGSGIDLTPSEGKPVRLTGRQYLVAGWRYPLVVADRLDPLPADPPPLTGPVHR